MKKLLGNVSGATDGFGGISVHHPPLSSAWFAGSQNSTARPLLSWNHAGKPPTLGLLLIGPMRSSAAWAVNGTTIDNAAMALATPLLILGFCIFCRSFRFVGKKTLMSSSDCGDVVCCLCGSR